MPEGGERFERLEPAAPSDRRQPALRLRTTMRVALTAAIAASLLWASVAQAESYLCVSDMATGFSYDKAQEVWKETSFKANEKYLVVRPSDTERALVKGQPVEWVVKAMGSDSIEATCEKDFGAAGTVMCDGFSLFRFSRLRGRFLRAHLYGYYAVDPNAAMGSYSAEGELTPLIEIGKCSRIP